MGLDMYIYSSSIKPDKKVGFRFDYYDPSNKYDRGQDSEIFYWRKHYALDKWFRELYPTVYHTSNQSLEIEKEHIDALDEIVKKERKRIDDFKNEFFPFKKKWQLWNHGNDVEIRSTLTRHVEEMETFINRAMIDLDKERYLYYDACW